MHSFYRVLGLDLGSKTLGVARSDLMQTLASGVEIFRFEDDDYDAAINYVVNYLKNNKDVKKVALGLPKNMDNTIGPRAQIVHDFKDKLETLIDCEIILVDERRTTAIAQSVLIESGVSRKKRKTVIDKQAAVLILQNYLDGLR